ncbi:MAG: CBS domain-containing protein [Gammaproteobacteria bacterium]
MRVHSAGLVVVTAPALKDPWRAASGDVIESLRYTHGRKSELYLHDSKRNFVTAKFKALSVMMATADTVLMRPTHRLPEHASLQSPAIDVMTDLNRVMAATVDPNLPIEKTEERMKNARVRLLFVLNESGDLLGLITLNDIKGMRPMRFQQAMGVSRSEVLVRDIMTPRDKLEALAMSDVAQSSVGDIIETLKRTGRQHTIVIERTPTGPAIRGLFSARQIGRQLGMQIDTSGIAWTFAELEAALSH